ncbi:MAG: hypothetical protein NTY09_00215, partial [bacterium]|nr:hypothetical protein [bacterium]
MNTWELVLWAVVEYGGKAIVICPIDSQNSIEEAIVEIAVNFNLNPTEHTWAFISAKGARGDNKSRSEKFWWKERDRLAIDLAEKIVPVSVRIDGSMKVLIDESIITGKIVDYSHQFKYSTDSKGAQKLVVPESCPDFENWYYLTHWTCRTYDPWPGETKSDFYRAIANSRNEYPRSASCTLKRILAENRLRASGNHIRRETPVVAFTSLEPVDALKLMKWRKRYVRPTFEPYGIAIFYRSAMRAGIRMVTYVKNGEGQSGEEKPDTNAPPELLQGYGIGDWPKELEWRSVGDLDLNQIPEEDIVVLVPSEREAEEFRKVTGFKIIGMDGGNQ